MFELVGFEVKPNRVPGCENCYALLAVYYSDGKSPQAKATLTIGDKIHAIITLPTNRAGTVTQVLYIGDILGADFRFKSLYFDKCGKIEESGVKIIPCESTPPEQSATIKIEDYTATQNGTVYLYVQSSGRASAQVIVDGEVQSTVNLSAGLNKIIVYTGYGKHKICVKGGESMPCIEIEVKRPEQPQQPSQPNQPTKPSQPTQEGIPWEEAAAVAIGIGVIVGLAVGLARR